jgi:hypothetical protein
VRAATPPRREPDGYRLEALDHLLAAIDVMVRTADFDAARVVLRQARALVSLLRQVRSDRDEQGRDLGAHRVPDDGIVEREVDVRDEVAESRDRTPRDA